MKNDYPKTKKFKKTPLIISVLFLLISCSIFFFLYKKTEENKINSEETQTKWETEALRREEIRSLDRSVKDIEVERSLLESHFAYSSDVVPFLDTIEQLAIGVNATPEIISVDIPKSGGGLLVAVKADGSFEAIYKFLMLLENSPYELEFNSASIQNVNAAITATGSVSSKWEATFKIHLLSFIQ